MAKEYAIVAENEEGAADRYRLCLEPDKTLALHKLAFPDAHGLKYRDQSTGMFLIVGYDEQNKKFGPPEGGWADKVFLVISKKPVPQPTKSILYCGSINADRRDKSIATALPTIEHVSKYLFYILEDNGNKSCVVCVDPYYFVTFLHGTHITYEIDKTKLEIYSEFNETIKHAAVVVDIHEPLDFVILKSEAKIIDEATPIATSTIGEQYILYGYGNQFQTISSLTGCIHLKEIMHFNSELFQRISKNPVTKIALLICTGKNFIFNYGILGQGTIIILRMLVLSNGNVKKGPFTLGSARGYLGDSGGSVWSIFGLIAINMGLTAMPSTSHEEAIQKAAIFPFKNFMVEIATIMKSIEDHKAKEQLKRDRQARGRQSGVVPTKSESDEHKMDI